MRACLSVLLIAIMAVTLQACSLRLPGIGIDIGDSGGGPPHCPPGQAKKGRC
ncbi:MAG: hypothetical protein R3216_20660 [Pseudomonas sp.]|nr:hypothetical protein [Pseudomonas sp.]MDX1369931.1 hypothetical protein [Pseudomonas sp.]MDX1722846.1 hypothetical protein [Pseudomonas sp.]